MSPTLERENINKKLYIVAGLSAVIFCVLPFYTSIVPPMTDVPQHMLVARIIAEYNNPLFSFSDYFILDWGFAPTTIIYGLLVPLQQQLGPYWSMRVLLFLWVLSIWLGLCFLAKARHQQNPWLVAILALPLVFSWYTYKGYLPYLLSWPLFLFTIGIWFKEWRLIYKLPLLWVLFVLLFGIHVVGAAATSAAIVVIAALQVIISRYSWRQFGLAILATLPTPILVSFFLFSGGGPSLKIVHLGILNNIIDVIKFTVTTLNNESALILLFWLFILAVVFIVGLRSRTLDIPLVAAAIILVIIAVVMPTSLGALWPAGPRLLPFAILLLVVSLPWFRIQNKYLLAGGIFIVISLSAFTTKHVINLDKGFRDYLSAIAVVKPGTNILPILEALHEGSDWTEPYRNLISYYTIEKGGSHPYIFAAPHIMTNASPLSYRQESDRKYAFIYKDKHEPKDYVGVSKSYDYVLIWGDLGKIEEVISKEMNKVYTKGRAVLYAKR